MFLNDVFLEKYYNSFTIKMLDKNVSYLFEEINQQKNLETSLDYKYMLLFKNSNTDNA